MRALFVTHAAGLYGASRSLQLLLRNYREVDFDVAVDRTLLSAFNVDDIARQFHVPAKKVFPFFLPFDLCTLGKDKPSFMRPARHVFWHFDSKRFYSFLRKNNYDFIHLNSLVLHSMITDEHPFIMHVRERFDGTSRTAGPNLCKAAGLVFIDDATYTPFCNLALPPHIIINNPFDMRPPGNDRARRGLEGVGGGRTVFAVIGRVTPEKGIDFIIRAFMEVKARNVVLLIVGRGLAAFVDACRKLAAPDERIVFMDEEPEIEKVYAAADYVLRGEENACVGRTVYEALYSGCHVMVPGSRGDSGIFFEYDRFQPMVHFYAPRNVQNLTALFEGRAQIKIIDRQYSSNVEEYVARFHSFVTGVLDQRAQHRQIN